MENAFQWYKLDNAAKVFPDITSRKRTNMFRVAVNLTEDVDGEVLQEALENIKQRFPTFFVKLKHGVFWYYYEYNEYMPVVKPEPSHACSLPDFKANNGYLFNVYYYKNRISVEMYHALSDGGGLVEFIKALVYRYFEVKGYPVETQGLVKTCNSKPNRMESEDSFVANSDDSGSERGNLERAYVPKGTHFGDPYGMGIINGRVPIKQIKELAKEHNCTVTAYIAALLTYAIFKNDFKNNLTSKTPIRIIVPVNMRKYYDSVTLRNFSLYTYTSLRLDGRTWTFDEILDVVSNQIKEGLKPDVMQKVLNSNVKIEKNLALKMVPNFIKKFAIKIGYKKMGNRVATCSFSNLGELKFPDSVQKYIIDTECNLTVEKGSTHTLTVCSNNGILTITINRSVYETGVEKEFFKFLAAKGVDVVVSSNLWEEKA